MGWVADVFSPERLQRLPGRSAIGHVRYSTAGSSTLRNAQPITRDVLPGLDRARPQREPGQRRGAAQGAGGPGGDLPVHVRLGGDPPPHRARGPPEPRADADAGPRPAERRLLARHAHAGHARRLPGSARVPAAGDRPARQDVAAGIGDVRPRPARGGVRARRGAGGDRAHRPERPPLGEAVPGRRSSSSACSSTSTSPARTRRSGARTCTRRGSRSAAGWPRSTRWRRTS